MKSRWVVKTQKRGACYREIKELRTCTHHVLALPLPTTHDLWVDISFQLLPDYDPQ